MSDEEQLEPQFTHRGLLGVGAVVAFALVVIVAMMTWMYTDLRKHERELRSLINPTPQQFRKQLKEGFKRCLAEPECRKLFPQLAARSKRHHHTTSSTGPHRTTHHVHRGVPSPSGGSSHHLAGQHTGAAHRPPRTVPNHRHHRHPQPQSPPPSGSPPPSALPAPLPQQPPLTVTVPAPLSVCSPVVQVNKCPSNPLFP